MAEGGIEKSSLRTVLGVDDEGISTSDTFDVVVKDHGVKEGLQFDSVCIAPVVETTHEDAPEKTLQVLYTPDANMQGNLKFATIAVYEAPRGVRDEATVSKIVHLRSTRPKVEASTVSKTTNGSGHVTATESGIGSDAEGIFASDPEALKYIRLGPKQSGATGASSADEPEEGIFASDPEALKFIRFGPKPGTEAASSAEESEEGIFASDPEALKHIRFGPKPSGATGASVADEPEEGIFASDPETLKFIRFGPKPGAAGANSADEPEGIFASDPEALKYVRLGPKTGTTGASKTEESDEGIFASDPEALKYIRFGPKPGTGEAPPKAEEPEEGIFVSDPEALKYIRFGPKPGASAAASNADEQEGLFASDPEALKLIRIGPNPPIKESSDGAFASDSQALKSAGLPDRPEEGELLAEASGVQLKDDRTFSVRVTGHQLPDGQQKKFVSVRSPDGRGGLTKEEVDNLDVSVETRVGEDGLVEKFVSVE